MKIARVETIRIRAPEWEQPEWWGASAVDGLYDLGEDTRDRPMALFNSSANGRADDVLYVVVRVETECGLYGYGAIGLGSDAVARAVEGLLAPLVIGHSPFDTELIWSKMYLNAINIGRKGMLLLAMSGIDIAIWDIIGKATGQPVYNLLGGRTRQHVRAYCSAGYAMDDLDRMAELASGQLKAGGYTAFKMRFGYGPRHGREGMRKNADLVRAMRRALGDDIDLMADAYMGWNRIYAVEMIRMLEEFNLAWVEEPLLPHDIKGYAELRRSVNTPIAAGEHEFTRWGFREMIEAGAVDYLQPDVNRLGGITEARKVWALAQAHDLPVVPHSHNFHNHHLIISHMNSSLSEHFPSGFRDADTFLSELFVGEAQLENGHLVPPTAPGLGVELNEDIVNEYRIN